MGKRNEIYRIPIINHIPGTSGHAYNILSSFDGAVQRSNLRYYSSADVQNKPNITKHTITFRT